MALCICQRPICQWKVFLPLHFSLPWLVCVELNFDPPKPITGEKHEQEKFQAERPSEKVFGGIMRMFGHVLGGS